MIAGPDAMATARVVESRRIMAVGRAIRKCPHRSGCAGCHGHKATCALNKGSTPGRVRRSECEACVLAARPDLRPPGWVEPEAIPVVAHRCATHQIPPTEHRRTPRPTAPRSGVLLDRSMAPAHWLDGLYAGASAFLLCGGPSVRGLDLRPLVERRGFLLMAVNNAPAVLEPGYLKPDLWTHVDGAGRFLPHLWRDPGVMKFTPSHKLGATLREKGADGRFRAIRGVTPGTCPNVWCYKRRADFDAETFLTDPLLSWGTAGSTAGPIGDGSDRNCRSVLLVALRVLHILGVTNVYLVGADFRMSPAPGAQYGFGQAKDATACASNNRKFAVLGRWLELLRPHLESGGMTVYNCTAGSELAAFDRVEYEDAIDRARGPCGRPVDSRGWYG
jgi:hypothetical protein